MNQMEQTHIAGAPIFVKVDDYKDVLETMSQIKVRLSDAKETLAKITELKAEEDQELQMWDNDFLEIERKLENLEKELTNPDVR